MVQEASSLSPQAQDDYMLVLAWRLVVSILFSSQGRAYFLPNSVQTWSYNFKTYQLEWSDFEELHWSSCCQFGLVTLDLDGNYYIELN